MQIKPRWARLAPVFTLLLGGGGQNAKIVIAPEHGARFIRPLGHIFKYVFRLYLQSSCAPVLVSPPSGDVDRFSLLGGGNTLLRCLTGKQLFTLLLHLLY